MTEAELRMNYSEAKKRLWGKPPAVVMARRLPTQREPLETPPEASIIDLSQPPKPNAPRWKLIIYEVCKKHDISHADLTSKYRDAFICLARDEAAYRMRTETGMSLVQIGDRIGKKGGHVSPMRNIRNHAKRMLGTM